MQDWLSLIAIGSKATKREKHNVYFVLYAVIYHGWGEINSRLHEGNPTGTKRMLQLILEDVNVRLQNF